MRLTTGCATAEELGSADDFDCLEDILDNGTGAARQALVYECHHDLREVVREIVEASVPEAAETLGDSRPILARYSKSTCHSRISSSFAATAGRRSART